MQPDPAACPFEVDRAVMLQRWQRLTFLHWSYEPAVVQRLLPRDLVVEEYEGRAWVGLVPFFMHVATGAGRSLPWAADFCETNVRTYVRDRDGRSGIWFFSLDAARLGAVVVARTTYRLPYFWSSMHVEPSDDRIDYWCRRRWPGPVGAKSAVSIAIGDAFEPHELGDLDHLLTAKWVLFSSPGSRNRFARAWHAPWSLHRATVLECHDELIEATGLPAPHGVPLAHYSPGVDVRIGPPERDAPG
ncbi:MAG TPA: DUF2071 domain-containing protein [Acidimicrobiales bacterium]|nr:DUF2071 domain-containing protein [Acidimicrobiales bacterium]